MIEPAEEGGFTAYVPALPGCVTEGDTEEETLAYVREAITLYVEGLRDQRRPVPPSGIPSGQGRIVDVPTL